MKIKKNLTETRTIEKTNLHFFLNSFTSEVEIWLLWKELMEIELLALIIILPSRAPKHTFLQNND